ncbi:MAG: DUF479 domain-containing protein [Ectothiorhodospiraceae bacterium]|nr:DUF479 domain-containing protein [Chromatiales bacterium]MCP5154553.1 DUF479 domain-containing protein [Ectothiorhodospiraceae bacterium]
MNYLAHLLLAEPTPEGRVGAVAGDFLKGPVTAELAPAVAAGVLLHRAIDRFTDAHPAHRRSRTRLSAARRRFAGIVVDVCYDHFLGARWNDHATMPLEAFTREVYAELTANLALLPPSATAVVRRMAERDWLGSYRELAFAARALDGIAARRPRLAGLAGAGEEIAREYDGLAEDFEAFFPELRAAVPGLTCEAWRAARSVAATAPLSRPRARG